jgi:hypothetical protein
LDVLHSALLRKLTSQRVADTPRELKARPGDWAVKMGPDLWRGAGSAPRLNLGGMEFNVEVEVRDKSKHKQKTGCAPLHTPSSHSRTGQLAGQKFFELPGTWL